MLSLCGELCKSTHRQAHEVYSWLAVHHAGSCPAAEANMQHMPQAFEAIALVAPPGISRCHWLLSNEREHEVDFDIDSDCDFLRYNN